LNLDIILLNQIRIHLIDKNSMKLKFGRVGRIAFSFSRKSNLIIFRFQGKPIPGHLYRTFLENECLLSLNDRGS